MTLDDVMHGLCLVLALIEVESSGKEKAVSKAGAIGLTQLMPGTAAELGVDPEDPSQNVKGGAVYLMQQLRVFKSVPLALAAYNCGPGRLMRTLRECQSKEWEDVRQRLPEETRRYVPRVLQVAERIRATSK